MDVCSVIKRRLEELGLEQKDLATAAEVTESYVSQLLARKKLPPAPDRTDIYEKMAKFLKLPSDRLSKLAELQRREELKRDLAGPPTPMFGEIRELIVRKCVPGKTNQVRAIFEKQPFGELECLVTQKLLDVVKKVVKEELNSENWLHLVARLAGRSYEQMRVTLLDFLDTDVFSLSPENCVSFLDRKSTRLNSSHGYISYAVFCLKKKRKGGLPPGFCNFRGIEVMCGPRGLPGEGDHLFHNNGDGTFADVSLKAGVSDPKGYYGFASVFVDVDDDGWLDLAVANDSVPKYLYRNKHDGTFEDLSYISGFALNDEGREQASMGIAVGDYNRDGKVDFYITNFSDDYNALYRNDGDGNFSDVTARAGIAALTLPFLGWGTGFLDYDNDGLLDIFAANGHVYPGVDKQDWGTTWAQRPLLFRNLDGAKFQEVPPATGSGLAAVMTARGAAFGDLFNDGHIDVVINNIDSTPSLLRNVVKNDNHWVTFRLIGGPKSPRDAIGAKVFLTAGGLRQRQDVFSGGSYGSSSDQRVHFGLGRSDKVERVEIHWPSGSKQEISVTSV